jgi:hypothetical protein
LYRYIVGVLTAAKGHEKRKAVRRTWGADPRLATVKFFVSVDNVTPGVVEAVQKEALHYDDMVLIHHETEDYWRITVKTLEMMVIAAASADVGGYTHLVKVDDDTLVRVTRLRKLIGAAGRANTVVAAVEKPTAPHRTGEFALTNAEWPAGTKFPTWFHGPCYALTMDLVKWVASSMEVDSKLKLEDISAAKWLDMRGGVSFVHSRQLNFNDCKHGDVTSHRSWPQHMMCSYQRKRCCSLGEARATPWGDDPPPRKTTPLAIAG